MSPPTRQVSAPYCRHRQRAPRAVLPHARLDEDEGRKTDQHTRRHACPFHTKPASSFSTKGQHGTGWWKQVQQLFNCWKQTSPCGTGGGRKERRGALCDVSATICICQLNTGRAFAGVVFLVWFLLEFYTEILAANHSLSRPSLPNHSLSHSPPSPTGLLSSVLHQRYSINHNSRSDSLTASVFQGSIYAPNR